MEGMDGLDWMFEMDLWTGSGGGCCFCLFFDITNPTPSQP